jgi:serine phosphatase RsbU (regulator of sigma subunit)
VQSRENPEPPKQIDRRDLDFTQELSLTGSWRLDPANDQLLWSDESYRIFDITRGTPLTYDRFLAAVHPEDRESVDQHWRAALGGAPYDIEHRIVVGDAVKWVRERAKLEFADDGRLIGVFGAVQDISERKRIEQAQRDGTDRLSGALGSVGRLHVFERRNAWLVVVLGAICQAVLFLVIDQLGSPSRYLGIPGAATALIGVVAAVTGGPLSGVIVALAGGVAYFSLLTDFGSTVAWAAIVISVVLWVLAAALAGLAGDWVRQQARQREKLLAHMLDERGDLADSLEAANVVLQCQADALVEQSRELEDRNQALEQAQEETTRLYAEQNDLVRKLQDALLDIPQELAGVKFGHLYRSATRDAQVGGDFYDVFEAKNGRVGLLIGDVSGHGVEAARIATLVKDTVHAFAHQFRRPHLVLRETNRLLVEKGLPGFVTAFLGFLTPEDGRLVYSSAGHPPPMVAVDGRVVQLELSGSPLGVFPDARYLDTEVDLQKGSVLLFYTDGIIEARRDADFFGEGRLAASLARISAEPVETLPPMLLDEVLAFSGGLLRDDAALLAVGYMGVDRSPGTLWLPISSSSCQREYAASSSSSSASSRALVEATRAESLPA